MAVPSRLWSAITVKPSCLLLPSERKPSDGSLVLKAAKLLGANTGFEASKLKVFFLGGLGKEKTMHPTFVPRTYTLTHCDLTANLTLSVSHTVNRKQALQAVIHGDSTLFSMHPELVDSLVWVYFHSNFKEFNKIECWGPLKDAAMAQPT